MERLNAMKEKYTEIFVQGKPVLFTDMRIDRSTVPKELYLYEVRHADEDWCDPAQIAKGILVNFFGSILTLEPIPLPADGRLDIDSEKEWDFGGGEPYSIQEFIEKYRSCQ